MQLSDGDYRDIQGLVRFGYKHLEAARFHLLTIADAVAARAWLSKAPVTNAVKGRRPDVALHVAFTFEGLQRLGGAPNTLAQFPYEFKSGMTEASRARRLGDVAANDPQWWPRQAAARADARVRRHVRSARRMGKGVEK